MTDLVSLIGKLLVSFSQPHVRYTMKCQHTTWHSAHALYLSACLSRLEYTSPRATPRSSVYVTQHFSNSSKYRNNIFVLTTTVGKYPSGLSLASGATSRSARSIRLDRIAESTWRTDTIHTPDTWSDLGVIWFLHHLHVNTNSVEDGNILAQSEWAVNGQTTIYSRRKANHWVLSVMLSITCRTSSHLSTHAPTPTLAFFPPPTNSLSQPTKYHGVSICCLPVCFLFVLCSHPASHPFILPLFYPSFCLFANSSVASSVSLSIRPFV